MYQCEQGPIWHRSQKVNFCFCFCFWLTAWKLPSPDLSSSFFCSSAAHPNHTLTSLLLFLLKFFISSLSLSLSKSVSHSRKVSTRPEQILSGPLPVPLFSGDNPIPIGLVYLSFGSNSEGISPVCYLYPSIFYFFLQSLFLLVLMFFFLIFFFGILVSFVDDKKNTRLLKLKLSFSCFDLYIYIYLYYPLKSINNYYQSITTNFLKLFAKSKSNRRPSLS